MNILFFFPMAPMKLMLLLVVVSQVHYVVEGAGRYSVISSSSFSTKDQQQEDLELQRQLRILNKSPIKTVQMEEGDTFDCIEIHKQPAFDNPLLKNHKIQMVLSSSSKELSSSTGTHPLSKILKPIGCPQGTVPIRRTSKDDLIRAKYFSQSHAASTIHPLTTDYPGQHIAGMVSKNGMGTFYGARGNINIAAPSVGNGQYSGAQIWVEAGDPAGELNTIQAGWGLAPSLFGDSKTRVVVYWSADALHKEGCYNQLCPGFVQVDKDFTVGSVITDVSQFQGDQYALKVTIYQDKDSGDWWLQAGDEDRKIGYWPKSLFNHLNSGATRVAWGGLVKGTTNGGPSPQMGNGHFPYGKPEEACSVVNLGVQNDDHDNWSFNIRHFETRVDGGTVGTVCYDTSYQGVVSEEYGESFMFGGPGGNNCGV